MHVLEAVISKIERDEKLIKKTNLLTKINIELIGFMQRLKPLSFVPQSNKRRRLILEIQNLLSAGLVTNAIICGLDDLKLGTESEALIQAKIMLYEFHLDLCRGDDQGINQSKSAVTESILCRGGVYRTDLCNSAAEAYNILQIKIIETYKRIKRKTGNFSDYDDKIEIASFSSIAEFLDQVFSIGRSYEQVYYGFHLLPRPHKNGAPDKMTEEIINEIAESYFRNLNGGKKILADDFPPIEQVTHQRPFFNKLFFTIPGGNENLGQFYQAFRDWGTTFGITVDGHVFLHRADALGDDRTVVKEDNFKSLILKRLEILLDGNIDFKNALAFTLIQNNFCGNIFEAEFDKNIKMDTMPVGRIFQMKDSTKQTLNELEERFYHISIDAFFIHPEDPYRNLYLISVYAPRRTAFLHDIGNGAITELPDFKFSFHTILIPKSASGKKMNLIRPFLITRGFNRLVSKIPDLSDENKSIEKYMKAQSLVPPEPDNGFQKIETTYDYGDEFIRTLYNSSGLESTVQRKVRTLV